MPQIQKTFVDLTTIVPAAWFNRLQKHLAGFLNLKVTILGDAVQVVASSSDGVSSSYIGGEMRRNDATVGHTFIGEASDTYNVYVVATAAVDTFAVEVSTTTPATSPFRKVAEVDWNGSAITALRGVRGRLEDHVHDGQNMSIVDHGDITGATSGDPHTQYSLADGSRDFTTTVLGVDPVASSDLATKGYADLVLRSVPVGGIFWWPTVDAAPLSFLIADGSEVSRTVYDKLFAQIGTTYGVGDGFSTFNIPDARGRMLVGAQVQGDLGDTGGSIEHTHTQGNHSHTQDSHSHTTNAHSHSGTTTGSAGSHSHTQNATGSSPTHTHTSAAHSHGSTAFGIAATGQPNTSLGRHPGTGDSGLFKEDDLDQGSSSTSHTHSDGSYVICDPSLFIFGNTSSNSASHTHLPAGNAYEHTHTSGTMSGSTASGGGTATGNPSTSHTHQNPTTASAGSHTHESGGSTGTASPSTNSGGAVSTGSATGSDTGSATYPFITVNAIVRFE